MRDEADAQLSSGGESPFNTAAHSSSVSSLRLTDGVHCVNDEEFVQLARILRLSRERLLPHRALMQLHRTEFTTHRDQNVVCCPHWRIDTPGGGMAIG